MERLIYTDTAHKDGGFLEAFELDLVDGNEDNFTLKMPMTALKYLTADCIFYLESDPSLGGFIEDYTLDLSARTVTYRRRTFRGFLRSRVFYVAPGHIDYEPYSDALGTLLQCAKVDDWYEPGEDDDTDEITGTYAAYDSMATAFDGTVFNVAIPRPPRDEYVFDPVSQTIKINRRLTKTIELYGDGGSGVKLVNVKRPVNHIHAVNPEHGEWQLDHYYNYEQGQAYYSTFETPKTPSDAGMSYTDLNTEVMEVTDDNQTAFRVMSQSIALGRFREEKPKARAAEINLRAMDNHRGDTIICHEEITGSTITALIRARHLRMTELTYSLMIETEAYA